MSEGEKQKRIGNDVQLSLFFSFHNIPPRSHCCAGRRGVRPGPGEWLDRHSFSGITAEMRAPLRAAGTDGPTGPSVPRSNVTGFLRPRQKMPTPSRKSSSPRAKEAALAARAQRTILPRRTCSPPKRGNVRQ